MTAGFTPFGNLKLLNTVRRLAAFVFFGLMVTGPVFAGTGQKLRDDVITVIKSQMAAFQRDDGKAAFSFASPDVQDQFGSPEAFLAAFADTYKPVYRAQSVTFLNLAYSRGRLVQRVLLQGPEGKPVVALFPMVQAADGSWRIDGCVLLPAAGKQVRIGYGRDGSG